MFKDDLSTLRVYWAGKMFTTQELMGNQLIAAELMRYGYKIILPQDIEHREYVPVAIRNRHLLEVFRCDVVVAHYNGTELDSGNVIEVQKAHQLGKPVVLVRSDFRAAGDGNQPWNLMASDYPRMQVLVYNSLASWNSLRDRSAMQSHLELVAGMYDAAIREALASTPVFTDEYDYYIAYKVAMRTCGGGFMLTGNTLEDLSRRAMFVDRSLVSSDDLLEAIEAKRCLECPNFDSLEDGSIMYIDDDPEFSTGII